MLRLFGSKSCTKLSATLDIQTSVLSDRCSCTLLHDKDMITTFDESKRTPRVCDLFLCFICGVICRTCLSLSFSSKYVKHKDEP